MQDTSKQTLSKLGVHLLEIYDQGCVHWGVREAIVVLQGASPHKQGSSSNRSRNSPSNSSLAILICSKTS